MSCTNLQPTDNETFWVKRSDIRTRLQNGVAHEVLLAAFTGSSIQAPSNQAWASAYDRSWGRYAEQVPLNLPDRVFHLRTRNGT